MRVIDIILESSGKHLSIGSLTHYEARPKIFSDLVRNHHNFTTKDNKKVEVDPTQADEIENTLTAYVREKFAGNPIPSGSLQLRIVKVDGAPAEPNTILPSGNLVKDTALAGDRGGANREKEKVGTQMQPSKFFGMKPMDKRPQAQAAVVPDLYNFIEAGAFRAGELHNKIVTNPKLEEMHPNLSNAIITAADEIQNGQKARVPAMLSTAENKAFRDYATEFLGMLALIIGGNAIQWAGGADKSKAFYEHLDKMGSKNLSDLTLYFPQDSANPLNDSTLVSESGKEFIVSSKAGPTGKGAAPSLDGLTIPDSLRSYKGPNGKNPFTSAIKFIETAQKSSGFLQPFALANLLSNKAMIGQTQFKKYNLEELEKSFKGKTITPVVQAYLDLFPSSPSLGGTPLGKLRYDVAKEVMSIVNNGAGLTNFKAAVLQILGYNFIQLNTKPAGGQFVTTVNWPATISGHVTLENKYGSGSTGGKLSFMIHS